MSEHRKRIRVRHYKGWTETVWRTIARIPIVGNRLKWVWTWFVNRWWVAYWIDGERM